MRLFKVNTIAIGLVFLLLIAAVFESQEQILHQREMEDLADPLVFVPGQAVGGIVLAGFKGIAVDILWIMLDENFHKGQWFAVLPMFHAIAYLQPTFIHNWSLGGWHMAFNISHEADKPEEKRQWILTGIDFVRKGIQFNRNRYELYFETAWIYYQKAKQFDDPSPMYDDAVRFLRRAIRYDHPSYMGRLVGHVLRKAGRIDEAIREYQKVLAEDPSDHIAQRVLQETLESQKEGFVAPLPSALPEQSGLWPIIPGHDLSNGHSHE